MGGAVASGVGDAEEVAVAVVGEGGQPAEGVADLSEPVQRVVGEGGRKAPRIGLGRQPGGGIVGAACARRGAARPTLPRALELESTADRANTGSKRTCSGYCSFVLKGLSKGLADV